MTPTARPRKGDALFAFVRATILRFVMSDASLRLFFALWPDATMRAALSSVAHDVAARTGGREVAAANLHVTLAFLGEKAPALVADLRRGAALLRVAPMRLVLDRIGCWRKTHIAWLAPTAADSALERLRADLLEMLARLGIVIDESRFVPHVTLARRIASPIVDRLPLPIEWRVDALSLVASELSPAGPCYRVIDAWPAHPA